MSDHRNSAATAIADLLVVRDGGRPRWVAPGGTMAR